MHCRNASNHLSCFMASFQSSPQFGLYQRTNKVTNNCHICSNNMEKSLFSNHIQKYNFDCIPSNKKSVALQHNNCMTSEVSKINPSCPILITWWPKMINFVLNYYTLMMTEQHFTLLSQQYTFLVEAVNYMYSYVHVVYPSSTIFDPSATSRLKSHLSPLYELFPQFVNLAVV